MENKLIVDLNSKCHDCSIKKKTDKRFNGPWQADMVEFLIDKKSCRCRNLTTSGLICQQPLTQRNCSMLCHKEWLAPSTTLPPKVARRIRRTV